MKNLTEKSQLASPKIYQRKLDWLSLVLHRSFNENIERIIAVRQVFEVFGEKPDPGLQVSGRIVIQESVVCFINSIQLRIEFEGCYFSNSKKVESAILLLQKLSEKFKENFSVSRLDVAIDILNVTPHQLFLDPSEYYYSFKFQEKHYGPRKDPSTIYLLSDKFEICIYRKDKELGENQMEKKKQLFLDAPKNIPITRFELRLKKKQETTFITNLLYAGLCEEQEIIKLILQRFAKKKNVRIIENKTRASNFKIHPLWVTLFLKDKWDKEIVLKEVQTSKFISKGDMVERFLRAAISRNHRLGLSKNDFLNSLEKVMNTKT